MEILSPYLNAISKVRLVLLMETSPLSNKYHQVQFTPEQFKSFTAFIQSIHPKCEHGNVVINLCDEEISLPENLEDFYLPHA